MDGHHGGPHGVEPGTRLVADGPDYADHAAAGRRRARLVPAGLLRLQSGARQARSLGRPGRRPRFLPARAGGAGARRGAAARPGPDHGGHGRDALRRARPAGRRAPRRPIRRDRDRPGSALRPRPDGFDARAPHGQPGAGTGLVRFRPGAAGKGTGDPRSPGRAAACRRHRLAARHLRPRRRQAGLRPHLCPRPAGHARRHTAALLPVPVPGHGRPAGHGRLHRIGRRDLGLAGPAHGDGLREHRARRPQRRPCPAREQTHGAAGSPALLHARLAPTALGRQLLARLPHLRRHDRANLMPRPPGRTWTAWWR